MTLKPTLKLFRLCYQEHEHASSALDEVLENLPGSYSGYAISNPSTHPQLWIHHSETYLEAIQATGSAELETVVLALI
jgi:hypothetical protein